ncbi:MAG: inverse autotransporter beta domain-containing protein [Dongiaceae bacterium]
MGTGNMGQVVRGSRLRSRLLVGVAAMAMAAPGASKALAQEAKWQPWLEAGGMVGTNHSFGDVDIFVPIWQDQTSLLFGDFRGTFSSEPTQEGNFGLGYRTQVDPSWILGGYGYFDIQNSENDNLFYQATLGLEALSVDWDFRVNGYIPFNAGGQSVDNGNGHLEISGNTIGITTDKEKPLYGFDGEVGWRLPIFPADGDMDVRAFIGGYFFTNSTSTRSRARAAGSRCGSTTSTSWGCSRA